MGVILVFARFGNNWDIKQVPASSVILSFITIELFLVGVPGRLSTRLKVVVC